MERASFMERSLMYAVAMLLLCGCYAVTMWFAMLLLCCLNAVAIQFLIAKPNQARVRVILVKKLVKLLHGFAKVVTYISFALLNKTQEQRTQQCLKAQCLGSVMTLAMFKFFSYKLVLLYNQLAEY